MGGKLDIKYLVYNSKNWFKLTNNKYIYIYYKYVLIYIYNTQYYVYAISLYKFIYVFASQYGYILGNYFLISS